MEHIDGTMDDLMNSIASEISDDDVAQCQDSVSRVLEQRTTVQLNMYVPTKPIKPTV